MFASWMKPARPSSKTCEQVCEALERTANPSSGPAAAELDALLARIPESLRQHVHSCEACRTFALELREVRGILAAHQNDVQPGPYFVARVMTAIADREVQLEKSAQTWAAVPRLAYRLSVMALLSLVIAGTWVYEMRRSPVTTAGLNSQSEGLVDSGPAQDDVLVGAPGR